VTIPRTLASLISNVRDFVILACCGQGAMAAIQQAIAFGYFCAAAVGVVTLALAYDMRWMRGFGFTLPVTAVMLLIDAAEPSVRFTGIVAA
jgi:hypothetical protein